MSLSDHALGEKCLSTHAVVLGTLRNNDDFAAIIEPMDARLSAALINYTGELIKQQERMTSNVTAKKEALDRTVKTLGLEDASIKGSLAAFAQAYDTLVQEKLGIAQGTGRGAA